MKVQDRRFSLPLPQRILRRGRYIDGQMIARFAGVFRTDVTLVVQTVVLDADA